MASHNLKECWNEVKTEFLAIWKQVIKPRWAMVTLGGVVALLFALIISPIWGAAISAVAIAVKEFIVDQLIRKSPWNYYDLWCGALGLFVGICIALIFI